MGEKKFWQELNNVGIDKECWGYEGILNLVSLAYHYMAEEEKEKGFACYKWDEERSNKLYKRLDEIGYYKH